MAKPPKYRNQRTRGFDSKLEARYAGELDLDWKAGNIHWFTRQVPFELEGGVVYRADFLVVRTYGTGSLDFNALRPPLRLDVVDVTGVMTQVKYNKLKQVADRYGITVLIYRRDGSLVPFWEVSVSRGNTKVG